MDGERHLIAGAIFSGLGLMVVDAPLYEAAIPLIIGGISGIAPDLDHHNSMLVKRVIKTTLWIFSISLLVTLCYGVYRMYLLNYPNKIIITTTIIGMIFSLISFVVVERLKPKKIIFISGIFLIIIGFSIEFISLILIGIFLTCASRLKHRGLTHSLYFLIFWSLICFYIQKETGLNYIWLTGTLGYLSHLLTDHWFTKTKIKWINVSEFKYFKTK